MVPGLSTGFVGQGVLPTPEGATAATSMACRQGGQTGQARSGYGFWRGWQCPSQRPGECKDLPKPLRGAGHCQTREIGRSWCNPHSADRGSCSRRQEAGNDQADRDRYELWRAKRVSAAPQTQGSASQPRAVREACTGANGGLEAYDHSRSMATGTGPGVRKCRGTQAGFCPLSFSR